MIHFVLAILTVCLPALARDNGQYENVTPDVRAWFRSQKSPKTGALCCNEADGLYAEEDIRDGHYWARWAGGNWEPVPDEVVIHEANPHGAPVVWWYIEKGEVKIRCFAPGSGM
jgi:hypothetical protein